jgi:inward rectifier potassium channel
MLSVPWPLFLGLLSALYLFINLLFACLYMLDPAGIGGASTQPAGFDDAFFFSVQTLGSLGYGALHPISLAVNLIATLESLAGMLFVAVTTGLAFARFARSSARIRFSAVATVHPYNGVPTLMFRVANERRNNILEARLKAFLAIDEHSSEGHLMRRQLPLPLIRDEGVAFLLTWTAMHPIDDSSPLHGRSIDDLVRAHGALVVAFSGVDETLERPIHARCSYSADQIAYGHCFVDMVETHDEGRTIDFSRFDQIRFCPLS